MVKKRLLLFVLVGGISLVAAAVLFAGTTVPDVIQMKNDYEHEKGIIQFTHAKHINEYEIGCGDCHHDDKGEPLTALKEGDHVDKCIFCHQKPGEVPRETKKEWRDKKLKRKEVKKRELEWHAEALHENCRGCHRKYNKDNKTKAAPTTCSKCHPDSD